VTTAANTVTLLEKSAGREQAASRHAVAFGPAFRVPLNKITRREAEDFNSLVLDRLAVLVPAREKIADRLQAQLADEFARDFLTLTKNFDKHDLWTELAKDALDVYQSVRRRDRDDKTTKAEVREYLRENEKGVNARIDRIVRRANERGLFDGSRETILLHMVLIAESGAKFLVRSLRGDLDSITKEILFGYQKAASPADKFLLYYTIGEGDFPPLPASAQMGELLDSIQKRTNEITLGGFNDKMFETVRGTIKENLYEAVDGGKGAAEIARRLGKELRAKFADLPKEANNRLMLWARTEGCVVQNDALMARGEDVGMDGKVWQTVGDSRVRDAHIMNEGAGVIPMADTFPDGSTDGGSGSVSPYQCRCAVGPALLPSKRSKKEEDKPKKPEAAAPATTPKAPRVPRVPKPKPATTPKIEPKPAVAAAEEVAIAEDAVADAGQNLSEKLPNQDYARGSSHYAQRERQLKSDVEQWLLLNIKEVDSVDSAMIQRYYDAYVKTYAEAIARGKLQSRVPSKYLDQILKDGTLRTQFETGKSKGLLNNKVRASYEREVFGYDDKLDPKMRPYYGYLTEAGDGANYKALSQYGDLAFEFKEEVRLRSTFSGGDSLNSYSPTPIANPEAGSMRFSEKAMLKIKDGATPLLDDFARGEYVEAQIHGDALNIKDVVNKVVIHNKYDTVSFEALRAQGITNIEVANTIDHSATRIINAVVNDEKLIAQIKELSGDAWGTRYPYDRYKMGDIKFSEDVRMTISNIIEKEKVRLTKLGDKTGVTSTFAGDGWDYTATSGELPEGTLRALLYTIITKG